MTAIFNREEYLQPYRGEHAASQGEALRLALDVRKFEIELYWKRATYFWTLIGATLVAFSVITTAANVDHRPTLRLVVACFGFILTLAWYQVNRGSKFWQENWERHVDYLEEEIIGPLHETVIPAHEYNLAKFWTGYPYSVTRVNQLVSLFAVFVWFGLGAATTPWMTQQTPQERHASWAFLAVTAMFVVLLGTLGKSSIRSQKGKSVFVRRDR